MLTCHALINLIDGITQSLDAKQYAIGDVIDLKRHSICDHKQLCKKCIRGVAFEWIISDLENRKEFVSFHKCNSDVRKLYILYINDMCNISNLIKYIIFAMIVICSMQMVISVGSSKQYVVISVPEK